LVALEVVEGKRGRREGGRCSYRIHDCRFKDAFPRNAKPRSMNEKGKKQAAVVVS
jgi:hypothetical protein